MPKGDDNHQTMAFFYMIEKKICHNILLSLVKPSITSKKIIANSNHIFKKDTARN